jgi:hypothetical protein
MRVSEINTEITADIKNRFNKCQEFTEVKPRNNARVHIAYANGTTDGEQYFVGIVTIKGEPTRVLGIHSEQIYFSF